MNTVTYTYIDIFLNHVFERAQLIIRSQETRKTLKSVTV